MNNDSVDSNNYASSNTRHGNNTVDIAGPNASQVIVSNLGATTNFCQLCGIDVPDISSHFGACPNEPGVRDTDVGQQVPNIIIPGDRINNMEYLLRCMRNFTHRM